MSKSAGDCESLRNSIHINVRTSANILFVCGICLADYCNNPKCKVLLNYKLHEYTKELKVMLQEMENLKLRLSNLTTTETEKYMKDTIHELYLKAIN